MSTSENINYINKHNQYSSISFWCKTNEMPRIWWRMIYITFPHYWIRIRKTKTDRNKRVFLNPYNRKKKIRHTICIMFQFPYIFSLFFLHSFCLLILSSVSVTEKATWSSSSYTTQPRSDNEKPNYHQRQILFTWSILLISLGLQNQTK